MRSFDVLIIGAGAAGLNAAVHLLKHKPLLKIAILEARNRLGGRILPGTKIDGYPIEMGPEFVHGGSDELEALLKKANSLVYELPELRSEYLAPGRLKKVEYWSKLVKLVKRFPQLKGRDRPLNEVLENLKIPAKDRELLRAYAEGFHAGDANRMSARTFKTAEVEEGVERINQRPADGYQAVLKFLQTHLGNTKIFLNHEVHAVQWKPREAVVHSKTGRSRTTVWRAKKLLITLPIGVLKAGVESKGAVKFAPEVPKLSQTLESFEMGHVVKLMLQFKKPIWEKTFRKVGGDVPVTFVHSPQLKFQAWWTYAPAKIPLLAAWCGGPRAQDLAALPKSKLEALAIKDLAKILDLSVETLRRNFVRGHYYNWSRDSASRGAYSYVTSADRKARPMRPVGQTLYFGGEAWAGQGEGGTVEAALVSGKRAAQQILRSMRVHR